MDNYSNRKPRPHLHYRMVYPSSLLNGGTADGINTELQCAIAIKAMYVNLFMTIIPKLDTIHCLL